MTAHQFRPQWSEHLQKAFSRRRRFCRNRDTIKKGSVLCIVEAMKVMNEIQSDVSGEVIEILVEDSTSVEYGQTLFKIRQS